MKQVAFKLGSRRLTPPPIPTVSGEARGELDLGGAARGERARVLGERLERVDSVVHGTLDVVHHVLGGAAEDDSSHQGVVPDTSSEETTKGVLSF